MLCVIFETVATLCNTIPNDLRIWWCNRLSCLVQRLMFPCDCYLKSHYGGNEWNALSLCRGKQNYEKILFYRIIIYSALIVERFLWEKCIHTIQATSITRANRRAKKCDRVMGVRPIWHSLKCTLCVNGDFKTLRYKFK